MNKVKRLFCISIVVFGVTSLQAMESPTQAESSSSANIVSSSSSCSGSDELMKKGRGVLQTGYYACNNRDILVRRHNGTQYISYLLKSPTNADMKIMSNCFSYDDDDCVAAGFADGTFIIWRWDGKSYQCHEPSRCYRQDTFFNGVQITENGNYVAIGSLVDNALNVEAYYWDEKKQTYVQVHNDYKQPTTSSLP